MAADAANSTTYYYYGDGAVSVMAVLLLAFMVLAVLGNAMVVLTVLRHRGMRTRTNMFIVNLAIADILVALLDMPVSMATLLRGDWVMGRTFCQFNGFTMALLLMCSIHTLMYMSVHKYLSITRPFSHRGEGYRKVAVFLAAAWLWPFFCAVTPFVGLTEIVYKRGASQCGPAYPRDLKMYSHSALITITNYFIPLGVMAFCYVNIFRVIADHMSRVKSHMGLHNSVVQQKRINITLFLVLICFLLCWTPYMIYTFYVNSRGSKTHVPYILNPVSYWFGYMNSACNPIIYAFRSPSFRHGYKEILFGSAVEVVSAEGNAAHKSCSSQPKSGEDIHASSSGCRASVHRPKTKRFLSQTSWLSLPGRKGGSDVSGHNSGSSHSAPRQADAIAEGSEETAPSALAGPDGGGALAVEHV
ncbi:alpha-2A adrenergic receptor [Rhipicephalus sanguineus]|uniref:alpha-2A adrenergic receptor n=1 Tax=Rhipicephalus sanguineus TaxID=34632 RepID=UPI0020C33A0B|nr:alpha-2A adrenergic receptor [Rhipicephalus sanguineus]